ncbi:hypothetical protein NDU88_003269 [Pleurodeles waltl]|uniref:Uncharacterized protein n=1 Tax=Pleurodeles waltl TaxID=8319 RepID=A0AAV7TP80_PLEWA|nr:hypothetical protein NDU88_003269 [Pleurodeles waltl]
MEQTRPAIDSQRNRYRWARGPEVRRMQPDTGRQGKNRRQKSGERMGRRLDELREKSRGVCLVQQWRTALGIAQMEQRGRREKDLMVGQLRPGSDRQGGKGEKGERGPGVAQTVLRIGRLWEMHAVEREREAGVGRPRGVTGRLERNHWGERAAGEAQTG